ncbi:hypothetical protein ROZALSC1DRAFT_29354 [Rozella allomycis CSF55]|uniref:Uncharacterized protein n=1 Tax=Rozella allomycis (strain CSF55) TaxID=988480 RepID=A0A075AZZ1_ROZAC|nr:hypothetical protein O9G_005130 [Rozella allomycis CSF55]RKP19010.1 hypothetical protein ROZALSC1DRAFT_29354 [Rozella allomycis CSF55]|eukprot:EPZ35684.1 hypothetical protein O9G_005130 [Rozella allomycis CSF55]
MKVKVTIEDTNQKEVIVSAVNRAVRFNKYFLYRDDENRLSVIFEDVEAECSPDTRRLIVKYIQEATASARHHTSVSDLDEILIDCSFTKIKTTQELSAHMKRELRDATSGNSNLGVFAIKKYNTKKPGTAFFKITPLNLYQAVDIATMPLVRRVVDGSGNSLQVASSWERLHALAPNHLILEKSLSSVRTDFFERKTKEELVKIGVVNIRRIPPSKLFLETKSFEASSKILSHIKNGGTLFKTNWYYVGGSSSNNPCSMQILADELRMKLKAQDTKQTELQPPMTSSIDKAFPELQPPSESPITISKPPPASEIHDDNLKKNEANSILCDENNIMKTPTYEEMEMSDFVDDTNANTDKEDDQPTTAQDDSPNLSNNILHKFSCQIAPPSCKSTIQSLWAQQLSIQIQV